MDIRYLDIMEENESLIINRLVPDAMSISLLLQRNIPTLKNGIAVNKITDMSDNTKKKRK